MLVEWILLKKAIMRVYGNARSSLAPILVVLAFFFLFLLIFGQKAEAAGETQSQISDREGRK
jgi:hypothetical protein